MKHNRIWALLLAALLLVQLTAPLALADEDGAVYRVESAEDWSELARLCRLDSWSDGVTVVLERDIVLPKNAQIPTFGGVFDGQGHTVSGLSLTGEGDHQGLFRYVREGAVVKGLTVSGTVAVSGSASAVGGLVGSNSGTVSGCAFRGVVAGTQAVGGVVGVNEVTGTVRDCTTASGAVSGEHFTGGVVGDNRGAVIHCENLAQINTQAVEPVPDLELDWEQLNSVDNLPTCTDTGGIAGYSDGLLQSCVNHGPVGYPHMGYNVGGVAGRQKGQLIDCENDGAVWGRKDVAGIVGQAEPFTELNFQEDTLKKLARELDTLSGLMSGALDSTDATRNALSGHLTSVTEHTGDAQGSVSELLDELESVGGETVDVANDLSGRVHDFLDEVEEVARDMRRASDRLGAGLDSLQAAAIHGQGANEKLKAAMEQLRSGLTLLNGVLEDVLNSLSKDTEGGKAFPTWPEGGGHGGMSPEEIAKLLEKLGPALDAIIADQKKIKDGMDAIQESLGSLKDAGGDVTLILTDMALAMGVLESGARRMEAAFGTLRDALEAQNKLPPLELPKLSPEFHETESALRESMTALNDELEQMNQTANSGGDDLSGQLRSINRQFTAITDVLRHAGEEFDDPDLVVDVSDEALDAVNTGRVQSCRNRGAVDGDVNVGGVVGAMAIELDFDPEDDVRETGEKSMKFQYLTRAVVDGCVNRGAVTGRKNCIGGIVGRMDLGVVTAAQSYGPVESTSGEEVGGVAGRSDSVIRDSWAKCSLSGARRVGGVAGFGTDIDRCKTLVEIRDAASCVGAIAGDAEGLVSGNVFLSDTLGGVDGISYDGRAKPVGWTEFQAIPNLPEEFRALTVRFYLDGKLIHTAEAAYGQPLPQGEIPQVPGRPCCYGEWEEFNADRITFDREIHAVYTPWLTTVADADGTVLAEGAFAPAAVLRVTPLSELPEVEGRKVAAGYALRLEGTEGPMQAVRVKLPEGLRRAELWEKGSDGIWRSLPTTVESSYLRAELETVSAELAVVSSAPRLVFVLLTGVLVLVVVCGILLLIKKQVSRRRKPEKQ